MVYKHPSFCHLCQADGCYSGSKEKQEAVMNNKNRVTWVLKSAAQYLAIVFMTMRGCLVAGCQVTPPPASVPLPVYQPPITHPVSHALPVTQIGRYLTVKNGATRAQLNPFLMTGAFHFPPSVGTVGEAVRQVLAPTGYRLTPTPSPSVKQTLQLPLPLSDRTLGPMTIHTALLVLMGEEVYELKRDPLHRLITFAMQPEIAQQLGVKKDV